LLPGRLFSDIIQWVHKHHLHRDHFNDLPNDQLNELNDEPNLDHQFQIETDVEGMSPAEDNDINDVEQGGVDAVRSKAKIMDDAEEATTAYIARLKLSTVPSSTIQTFVIESRELIDNIVSGIEEIAQPIVEDIASNTVPPEEIGLIGDVD
jgi:hypothetical protein